MIYSEVVTISNTGHLAEDASAAKKRRRDAGSISEAAQIAAMEAHCE
jgi:hypothetical protein